jgi:hypothetical protein
MSDYCFSFTIGVRSWVQQDDAQLSQIASKFVSVVQVQFVPTNGLPGSKLPVETVPRIQLDVSKFRGPFFGGEGGGHD